MSYGMSRTCISLYVMKCHVFAVHKIHESISSYVLAQPTVQYYLFTDNPIFDASLYAHVKWEGHRYARIHIPSIPHEVFAYYVPASDW